MLTLLAGSALAQTVPETSGSVQTMHLSVDGHRTLWTDDAARAEDGTVVARGVLSYAHRPLVWEWGDGTTDAVVGSAWQLDAIAAASWGGARLGLDVPLLLGAGSDVFAGGGTGLGDLALDGRYTVLDPARMPLGLAVAGRLTVPTATVRVPMGAPGVGWELTAIADREVGPVLLAVNLGTRGGPPATLGDIEVDDQFVWRVGAGWEANLDLGLSAELAGRVAYRGPLATGAPVEAMVGSWAWLTESVVARLGVSAGLGQAIGTPGARVLAAVAWEPPTKEASEPEPVAVEAPVPGALIGIRVQDPSGATAQNTWAWVRCGHVEERISADQAVELPAGPCTVEATGEGWGYVSQPFEVVPGTPEEHILHLESEGPHGRVSVALSGSGEAAVERASWRFDDGPWTRLHRGEGVASVAPGPHTVVVGAPGFASQALEVDVETGGEVPLQVVLEPSASEE